MAVLVEPELRGTGLAPDEHGGGFPVVPLPWEIVASFQQQDALAGTGEPVRERAPTGAGADHDDVEVLISSHECSLRRRIFPNVASGGCRAAHLRGMKRP